MVFVSCGRNEAHRCECVSLYELLSELSLDGFKEMFLPTEKAHWPHEVTLI